MKIPMSGASGFIGSRLSQFLNHEGHEIVPLGRELFRPENEMPLCRILSTCRAVVNLAGAPIDKRWTHTYKQQLIDSRVEVTRCLTKAMKKASPSPAIFVSASAVGYYPDWGEWDEYNDVYGNDFLAHLCREWEGAARECPEGTRLVITRFGIVLSRDGGALPPLLNIQRRLHAGVVIGNGQQPFPWISLPDLCRAYSLLLRDDRLSGVFNFTVPCNITQRDLARDLADTEHIDRLIPIPRLFFRILYGERSHFITNGQWVSPTRLQEAGFIFHHPTPKSLLKGAASPVGEE